MQKKITAKNLIEDSGRLEIAEAIINELLGMSVKESLHVLDLIKDYITEKSTVI